MSARLQLPAHLAVIAAGAISFHAADVPAPLALPVLPTIAAGAPIPASGPERGALAFHSIPASQFRFSGMVGDRIQANTENWLLRAPQANPGMIEMFRVRDRQPTPQLVPWAGEFVGKFLISGVQALHLTDDPRLSSQLSNVVAAFIATQAEDGYLGPFPKKSRLLGNWDLWGHYHAIQALLLWHEQTGDTSALTSARKAADLVCKTYLNSGRRVFDAGDPEMNMSIATSLLALHRLTNEPRYLEMAREVEKDWERAGDYLRAGIDGREFYQSPRPRWESLHDLQGLLEFWRVTGDQKYREAFVHHWRSLRRWDRRNTGGFSSGEQATGNPYAPTPIETCCTVAWMALTVDYLRLTGDPRAADDLELATLNAGLGAQHPSGRWWTYNTPMDGSREASAHTIVFQARAGTPELNCCSVNAPRALGMLCEWAVMAAPDGLAVNWHGPVEATVRLADASPIRLRCASSYPVDARANWTLSLPNGPGEFTISLRIPGWSKSTRVQVNGEDTPAGVPGTYHKLRRLWRTGDRIEVIFDLSLRAEPGANEAQDRVSLYRGPVLLAWDPRFTKFDEADLPAVDLNQLASLRVIPPPTITREGPDALSAPPWLPVDIPVGEKRTLRLVDFASAGATGLRYRSWLPAKTPRPAPAMAAIPRDGARFGPGETRFQWRLSRRTGDCLHRIEFATNEAFQPVVLMAAVGTSNRLVFDTSQLGNGDFYWRVVSSNAVGETVPDVPPARFVIDPVAPRPALPPEAKHGPRSELILHSLRNSPAPEFGAISRQKSGASGPDGTEFDGLDQMIVYSLPSWPEGDFSVAVRVKFTVLPPKGRLGQVFSAWAAGMDDPLRLVVTDGKLFARVEAENVFSTDGTAVQTGRWFSIAAVKSGSRLSLHVDGRAVGSCAVPEFSVTQARDCALGGNPHYAGHEFLAGCFADFGFYDRALSAEEIARQAGRP